jgi:hypothetical protein
MIRQQPITDDDDDPFDRDGLLRDGHVARVRMNIRDGRPVRTFDSASQHRPGYRTTDAYTAAERQRLYDEYDKNVTEAWRTVVQHDARTFDEPRVGDVCTVRSGGIDGGAPGHLRMVNGQLTCVADPQYHQRQRLNGAAPDLELAQSDSQDLRKFMRDHQAQMAIEYANYEEGLHRSFREAK